MQATAEVFGSARVFDSNALIYHLNDAYPPERIDRVDGWIEEGAAISVVTRIEVLGFRQPAREEAKAKQLLSLFTEVPLREAIVRQTIALRKKHRIELPDAVIAATALDLGIPLVTRNSDDFGAVDGLDLLNPFGD